MQLLSDKKYWVFDLDNTLYPAKVDLFVEVDRKMRDYVSELLGVDEQEAHNIQKDFLYKYGTTLSGLMKHYNVEPNDFLDYVHDLDYSVVPHCNRLIEAIGNLDGKKIIHTNGTKSHAINVLKRLKLLNEFDGLFGLEDCDYIPKPNKEPYEKMISTFGIEPTNAVFFEDMARNLKVPSELGFETVWIHTDCQHAQNGSNDKFVNHKIDCLATFLASI